MIEMEHWIHPDNLPSDSRVSLNQLSLNCPRTTRIQHFFGSLWVAAGCKSWFGLQAPVNGSRKDPNSLPVHQPQLFVRSRRKAAAVLNGDSFSPSIKEYYVCCCNQHPLTAVLKGWERTFEKDLSGRAQPRRHNEHSKRGAHSRNSRTSLPRKTTISR